MPCRSCVAQDHSGRHQSRQRVRIYNCTCCSTLTPRFALTLVLPCLHQRGSLVIKSPRAPPLPRDVDLEPVMQRINEWDFDIFAVANLVTSDCTLTAVGIELFRRNGFQATFCIAVLVAPSPLPSPRCPLTTTNHTLLFVVLWVSPTYSRTAPWYCSSAPLRAGICPETPTTTVCTEVGVSCRAQCSSTLCLS